MKLALVAALLTVGLLVYAPLWTAGWVGEDQTWLMNGASGTPSLLHTRGLTTWTWGWTRTPLAAHLTSLTLHGMLVLLTGLYVWRVGFSVTVAWVTSLFLLIHPVAVETVAYASSRSEQIAALAVMGACLVATWAGWWKWPVIAVAFGIGMMGKESAIVLCGLVPLTLWMTGQSWRKAALVSGGVLIAGVVWYGGPWEVMNFPDFAPQISAGSWGLLQSAAAMRILLTTIMGIGMTPDFDYDHVSVATQVCCLIGLGSLGMIAWECRATLRAVTFVLAAPLMVLAPRFVVQTPSSYLNEHQVLLALPWLLLGAALALVTVGATLGARVHQGLMRCGWVY